MLLLMRLVRTLALVLFIFIATYFSMNSVTGLFAQSDVVCLNPDFEIGDLSCWEQGGSEGLFRVVQTQTVFEGNYAALIGDTFTTQEECAGNLPLGSAWISYIITVPIQGDPHFSFKYKMYSYDEIVEGFEDDFDKFDVYIDDLSDSEPKFRILRTGSHDGMPPPGPPRPCDFAIDETPWLSADWNLSSISDFDTPSQTYDLRGKTINIIFQVFSQELVGSSAWYNTWVYIDDLQLQPEIVLYKENDPSGPVHEGDVITYTIAYANTSLITQTITITDVLPYNLQYIPGSASPTPTITEKTLVWARGDVSPGNGGEITFQARVALLPSLQQAAIEAACPTPTPQPAYVLPAPIACDTTRFWANGVTRQPPEPNPHTIIVQIPPGATPSAMWLLMKGTGNTPPTVEGVSADLLATTNNIIGASVFTAAVTPAMVDQGEITVVTYNPDKLNAVFLYNQDDPPFEVAALNDFYDTTATTTYTLEMPSVLTETMDVILPFMDITYWDDDNLPDDRITEVTVQYDDQPPQTVKTNEPNLGNGLLMTQFAFNVAPLSSTLTSNKVLTVTVDTEDSIYTLGPRICRPVYIENTALLCSTQAGCISDTAKNIPEHFNPYGGIYLPIIMKNSS